MLSILLPWPVYAVLEDLKRMHFLQYMYVSTLVKIQGGGLNLFSVFSIPFFIFALISPS